MDVKQLLSHENEQYKRGIGLSVEKVRLGIQAAQKAVLGRVKHL